MPSALANLNECVWNDYLLAQDSRLPVLPPVEQLSDRVIRVLGGNAGLMRLQGTNTYLIGTGQSRLLVDTGQGERFWIEKMQKVLEQVGITISHILLTHWHSDHTGGVPDLVELRPELSDRIYKGDPDKSQNEIRHDQVFKVDGATLRAVFTPGHAHDHMCFHLEEENALFTGDNVLGHGQSVFEDLGLFTKSLSDMAALNCRLGYPGHGDVIRDLPNKMRDVIRQKEYYERQVHQALACSKEDVVRAGKTGKGSLTVHELIATLYGEIDRDIYAMAIKPRVMGTLGKLAEDKKVGFEITAGEKRWFIRDRRARRLHSAKRSDIEMRL